MQEEMPVLVESLKYPLLTKSNTVAADKAEIFSGSGGRRVDLKLKRQLKLNT